MAELTSVDLGIDLGTTFSVLAVKGEVKTVENTPRAKYLKACDVSILPTPYGDYTFPSALWVDPTGREFKYGAAAKQLVTEGEAPIMFSKRSIGTTEKLRVNGQEFTARQCATLFLKYLKGCAEQSLGRPVRRAVVTHPAYFNENQVQETLQAAADAGFEMTSRDQMLMEPTAAALAYTKQDTRDPLRVMTYDLGGGTFDVTILERQQGVISIKAFDGDPLLGGYNFDRELVQWIFGRLRSSGRKIPFDPKSAVDLARRARLLVLAESVKIRLSNLANPLAPVPLRDPDCLVDEDGNPVQIMLEITPPEYTALIREHLDRATTCCRRALATAGLDAKQIDTILLVGGSTYGPWVSETVKQAFHLEPQLYEPDLCVAAGAAIAAAELPGLVRQGSVTLEVDAPATSVLPQVSVSGSLQSSAGKLDWTTYQVQLSTGGRNSPAIPDALGRFVLPDVELQPDGPTRCTLRVRGPNGAIAVEHAFSVTYSPTGSKSSIDTVLPKAISVRIAGGMKLVAAEGSTLPTSEFTVDLRRIHSDASLEIPVFQKDDEVGAIRVDNIPASAGAGSAIKLCLRVNEQNELQGTATVYSRTGSVAASCGVGITFPPLEIPSLAELKSSLDELEGQRQQQLALADDPEFRTMLGGAGKKLSQRGRRLLGELQPDRYELYQVRCELDRLVNPPLEEMDPPPSQFRRYADACRNLIEGSKDLQIQSYGGQLQQMESDANRAHEEKNHRLWTEANRNLVQLHDRLNKASVDVTPGPPSEPDPAWALKDMCRTQIERMERELESRRRVLEPLPTYGSKLKARCDELADSLAQMTSAVDAVPDEEPPRRAQALLSRVMKAEKDIRRAIPRIEYDAE